MRKVSLSLLLFVILFLTICLLIVKLYPRFLAADVGDLQKLYYVLSPIITVFSVFIAFSILRLNNRNYITSIGSLEFERLKEKIKNVEIINFLKNDKEEAPIEIKIGKTSVKLSMN